MHILNSIQVLEFLLKPDKRTIEDIRSLST